MSDPSVVSPHDQRVTFVELFFDLVFVFSVTQIVGLLHDGIRWQAVGEAVLVFWLVWWAWTQFTWALNAANTDHARIQFLTLAATGVAFFLAVSVPLAFGGGALWFAGPYILLRIIGLVVYVWVAESSEHRAAVQLFAGMSVGGLAAVAAGAAMGQAAQHWLWGGAILLDVIAATVAGQRETWNLHPSHFVERHGLIVIIALGESLIVAASGLSSAAKTPALIAVSLLSVALACALWWSYFPYVRPALERALEEAAPARRGPIARDVFSLTHFPMLCGIVAVAAVIEEVIAHPDHPLPTQGRIALAAGVLLFLGGSSLAKWRALRVVPVVRLFLASGTAVAVVALAGLPTWASLALALVGPLAVVVVEERARARLVHGVT